MFRSDQQSQQLNPPKTTSSADPNQVLQQIAQEVREVIRLLEADKQTGTPSGYVKQARTRLKQLAKSL